MTVHTLVRARLSLWCLLFGLRVSLLMMVVVIPAVLQSTVLQNKGQISSQTQHYYV